MLLGCCASWFYVNKCDVAGAILEEGTLIEKMPSLNQLVDKSVVLFS